MNILRITLGKLRNATHFQFHTEVRKLIDQFGAYFLKITRLFEQFVKLLAEEDECLIILQKSGYTEQMAEADRARDIVFSGLVDMVNAAQKHFDSNVVAAGNSLKIVFDTYGNLAAKPNDEQTSGVYNLVQDLEGRYAADIQQISAGDWVAELKARNIAYNELVRNRDAESAQKPEGKMKNIRVEIDRVYRDIITAVESLAKLTEDPKEIDTYRRFIAAINPLIERYRNRIAQREGMNAAKKNDNE